jgi:hypothetical protein
MDQHEQHSMNDRTHGSSFRTNPSTGCSRYSIGSSSRNTSTSTLTTEFCASQSHCPTCPDDDTSYCSKHSNSSSNNNDATTSQSHEGTPLLVVQPKLEQQRLPPPLHYCSTACSTAQQDELLQRRHEGHACRSCLQQHQYDDDDQPIPQQLLQRQLREKEDHDFDTDDDTDVEKALLLCPYSVHRMVHLKNHNIPATTTSMMIVVDAASIIQQEYNHILVQRQQIRHLLLYLLSIVLYIGLNCTLLYINISCTQEYIESHYYIPFHMSSFWGVFLFALIEAFVYFTTLQHIYTVSGTSPDIYETKPSIITAASVSSSSSTTSYSSMMIVWNVMSTFSIAILFTIDPTTFEIPAHYMEYTIQIAISCVTLVFFFQGNTNTIKPQSNNCCCSCNNHDTTTTATRSSDGIPEHQQHQKQHPPIHGATSTKWKFTSNINDTDDHAMWKSTNTMNAYQNIECIVVICVLLLSMITLLCYTRPNYNNDSDSTTAKNSTNGSTLWFLQYLDHVISYMGGPEHTAHTMEFVTEILNGIFVYLFTYMMYVQLQQQEQEQLQCRIHSIRSRNRNRYGNDW